MKNFILKGIQILPKIIHFELQPTHHKNNLLTNYQNSNYKNSNYKNSKSQNLCASAPLREKKYSVAPDSYRHQSQENPLQSATALAD